MPAPLAYFLTWTTHGTWLHGDERGSVDATHNARGTPRVAPDAALNTRSRSRMRGRAVVLTPDAREVVAHTIREHCELRNWVLRALNVRSNHVHAVVSCPERTTPEEAMSQLKAWATRRLRETGHAEKDSKVWTEHGSTRWIGTESSLAQAIDYVENHQS